MLFPENWSSASLTSTCQESLWTFRMRAESWWNAGSSLVSMILDAKNMRCSMITCTHRQRTTEVRLKAFALKKMLWVLFSVQNIPMSLRVAGEQGKQLNGLFMMVLSDLSRLFCNADNIRSFYLNFNILLTSKCISFLRIFLFLLFNFEIIHFIFIHKNDSFWGNILKQKK